MAFVPMSELLQQALAGGYAVPAFCVWNAEAMEAVMAVAADLRSPVILMNGPCEFALLRPPLMAAVAQAVVRRYRVPVALHLDHGDSIELVHECLAAGYSSVMLDFSTKPLAENVEALRTVVGLARPRGVTVEGEIGAVGRADSVIGEGTKASLLTEPAEAEAYARQTGVDALAISFGNAHGIYTTLPQFDFQRLAAIRSRVAVPLVLHGGSGTPDADLAQAIRLGIAKVNIASDLVRAVRQSLLDQWGAKRNLWLPLAMGEAREAMAPVVGKWIERVGAAGRA
jgi:ketose-bisphosphate aldolase